MSTNEKDTPRMTSQPFSVSATLRSINSPTSDCSRRSAEDWLKAEGLDDETE